MAESNSSSSGGIGLFGFMFLIFLTLKLTNTIDWSWWLVAAPLCGPLAVVMALALIVLVCKILVEVFK